MSVRMAKILKRFGLCVTYNPDKQWIEIKIDKKKSSHEPLSKSPIEFYHIVI